MGKLMALLFALCVVPFIVTDAVAPFELTGSVYCDTCHFGFETELSTPLADATVSVQCTERTNTSKLTYVREAVTNWKGQYKMLVHEDHGDTICDVVLVKSANFSCSARSQGCDRSRVILTRNNGMSSNKRFANALGFFSSTPLSGCAQILQKYQEAED